MREVIFVECVASGHGPLSLRTARDAGLSVAFFAKDPAFYEVWGSAHPLADADRVITTNTSCAEEMMRHVDPERTVGVVALDDFHLESASELAARLGLPHARPGGIRNARRKDATRRRLLEHGVARPRFACVRDGDEPETSPVGYPCVLKPSDGTGSVAVTRCGDDDELRHALRTLRRRWRTIRDHELSRSWMIEEYVEGPELSAEMIWYEGRWELAGLTRKYLGDPPYFVEIGHVFPAPVTPALREVIAERCGSWLEAIGLDFGVAHVELRLAGGVPVLMEINPRLGGGMIPELVRLATGFDILRHVIDVHTGAPIQGDPREIRATGAAAVRFLIPREPGVIETIRGRDTALSFPGVTRCVLASTPTRTGGTESSYDRLGYVVARGDDAAAAERHAIAALSSLELVYR
jgi:cysteine synthase A